MDHDERLRLANMQPGRYDVRLTDERGRSCLVRGVEGKPGRVAFSLADSDLTHFGR